jgi:hypothetical protein
MRCVQDVRPNLVVGGIDVNCDDFAFFVGLQLRPQEAIVDFIASPSDFLICEGRMSCCHKVAPSLDATIYSITPWPVLKKVQSLALFVT